MSKRTKFPFSEGTKSGMFLVVLLTGCLMSGFAQEKVVQVMKNGTVIFQSAASGIDSVVFYNPVAPANEPSTDVLVVNKSVGAPAEQTLLDDIRKLVFTSSNLSLVTESGSTIFYPFADITRLNFAGGGTTGINTSTAGFDVSAYLTPQGEVVVLTEAFIHSLTLLGMEGKILCKSYSNTLSISHLPAGVYLLRIETIQGTVVKKIINRSNIR